MPDTLTSLVFHVVFSTKDRIPLIRGEMRDRLHPYIGGLIKNLDGVPIAVGGVADHVHLVMELPPRVSLADTVRIVKSNSSRWVNGTYKHIRFGWQNGYSAFTVSRSILPQVVSYVRNQERHHQRRSFADELGLLLERHGCELPAGGTS
jgi:REP element-mobilizing transposase RayT